MQTPHRLTPFPPVQSKIASFIHLRFIHNGGDIMFRQCSADSRRRVLDSTSAHAFLFLWYSDIRPAFLRHRYYVACLVCLCRRKANTDTPHRLTLLFRNNERNCLSFIVRNTQFETKIF